MWLWFPQLYWFHLHLPLSDCRSGVSPPMLWRADRWRMNLVFLPQTAFYPTVAAVNYTTDSLRVTTQTGTGRPEPLTFNRPTSWKWLGQAEPSQPNTACLQVFGFVLPKENSCWLWAFAQPSSSHKDTQEGHRLAGNLFAAPACVQPHTIFTRHVWASFSKGETEPSNWRYFHVLYASWCPWGQSLRAHASISNHSVTGSTKSRSHMPRPETLGLG